MTILKISVYLSLIQHVPCELDLCGTYVIIPNYLSPPYAKTMS
jgi:hypothetical protein